MTTPDTTPATAERPATPTPASSPIQAAHECLARGGTLPQALATLAQVAALRGAGHDDYPFMHDAVFAAAKAALFPKVRARAHLKNDNVFNGLTGEQQRQVLDAAAETFPDAHDVLSDAYCAAANRLAGPLPKIDDETLPAVSVAGVLVFVYLHHETGALCVSVDLEETWSALRRPDSTIPLQVTINGTPVFDDSNLARANGTTVPAPLPGIAGEFTPLELDCLARTAGEAAGGGNGIGDETLSAHQLALAERAYDLHMAEFEGEDTPTS
ncbi:hypothetical protein [Nonomuraea sp. NPDC052265]|uniref:hypothetical protein n=1 Tax=Nonomuraea sp. NPDC052265 TaxID=3364374 RepID=UPI0037C7CDF2